VTSDVSLNGCTIALPETRELDLMARIIGELGGVAYRCPFVSICNAPDASPIVAWLRQLVAGEFDDLVLLTGEGVVRLVNHFARSAGIEEPVLEALRKVRTVSRGPKPARALRTLGLRASMVADMPTTEGVIATLTREDLKGRRVGVQLFGEEPNEMLIDFLLEQGARVFTVAPYVYVPSPDAPLLALMEKMAQGEISAIAFTSSSQVHRLWELADREGIRPLLERGLDRTWVAAVGPIVASTLEAKGARVDVVPQRSFFLRPMVNEMAAFLGGGNCAPRSTSLDRPSVSSTSST
jgi:uroporphyrinogen-III synthase